MLVLWERKDTDNVNQVKYIYCTFVGNFSFVSKLKLEHCLQALPGHSRTLSCLHSWSILQFPTQISLSQVFGLNFSVLYWLIRVTGHGTGSSQQVFEFSQLTVDGGSACPFVLSDSSPRHQQLEASVWSRIFSSVHLYRMNIVMTSENVEEVSGLSVNQI